MPTHARNQDRLFIGRRIRTARVALGWSLEALSRQAGIARGRLASCEAGRLSPTVAELECIALVLRLPLGHFFGPCLLCGSGREGAISTG